MHKETPIHFKSATELLKLLRTRQIGAVEVLQHHLERVERLNGDLNAVVTQDVESALRAAREADNRPKADLPPLHGLPMTIKEAFNVVGMQTTCGFPHLVGNQPSQDADAVAMLKAAGAVVFGKTNVPVGAFDWQAYNPVYGSTNNPWNAGCTPGGSSGGSAAALAAGLTPLELGSDIGGSIRVPAHFCGVYGHRPSYGLVPAHGHVPPIPGTLTRYELAANGPLARSGQDLELALDLIVAPAELERPASRLAIPPSRHERLQDFRVAVWADDSAYAVDARSLDALRSYADDLRKLGVTVDEKARPDYDWKASADMYFDILMSICASSMPPQILNMLADKAAALPPDDAGYIARMGRVIQMRHYQYYALTHEREVLYRAWRDFFTHYDVLICPAFATVAYEHDRRGDGDSDPFTVGQSRSHIVNGQPIPYWDGLHWPSMAVVANLPATAVPTGRFIDGLPLGVQIMGPYLEDRTPLRFAQLVEQELGGFIAPSAYL
ncbi:amidase [Herbaspirillum rubrisubalbicans]|uniref:Amidase n=1 Tax=Herbaspirillum rubrisubalbicans TaxID=80842 RepID=A0ABX9BXK4_9BURK|nr:amidase [Herbaspirillum rubrisubalbicans]RAM62675.1 amidase [Herbaspirillum rubrisubalbicans]